MLKTKGYQCSICGSVYPDIWAAEEHVRECFDPSSYIREGDMYLCGRCGESFCDEGHAAHHEEQCKAKLSQNPGECVSCAMFDADGYRHEGCPALPGSGNREECPNWRQATK